ncbi:tetrapyrrole methylase family protein [Pycnococcus provasolii]
MAPPRPRHTRPRSSHTTTLLRHRSGVCARHPTSSLSSASIRPPLFLLFGEPRRDSCIRLVANRCWRSHASSSGSTHSSVPASATESDRKTSQHSPDIAVVGLGPCGARHLTLEALAALVDARVILTRTKAHPTLAQLPPAIQAKVKPLDEFYEHASSFQETYDGILKYVVQEARTQPGMIAYAVPGDPTVAESAAVKIQNSTSDVEVRVVCGVSFVEPTLAALGVDMFEPGLVIHDAMDVISHAPFPASMCHTATPALYAQVCTQHVASELKLCLFEVGYDDEHEVSVVHAAGGREHGAAESSSVVDRAIDASLARSTTESSRASIACDEVEQRVERIPLYELDRVDVDVMTSVYVPPRRSTDITSLVAAAHRRSYDADTDVDVADSLRIYAHALRACADKLDSAASDMSDADAAEESLLSASGDALAHTLLLCAEVQGLCVDGWNGVLQRANAHVVDMDK